ncbi:MAG: NAD(P)-dependent oxidoreductase [Rhizobiaceae bacterium]|nr:NAD(P)-dependent oxidoreductase [Rhizobiaceae bacterium]
MTVLIFGSEGNIGRRLLRAFPSAIGVDKTPGADIVVDLADCDYGSGALAQALKSARCVIHLATSADPAAPAPVHLAAVTNTSRLVQACLDARIPRLVLPSSDWAEPKDPALMVNAYGQSKRAIEALAAMYCSHEGLEAVALRIGWVPGSDEELAGAPDWLLANHWSDERLISAFREAVGLTSPG